MARENKVINVIKLRIEEAEKGTLFFNRNFPENDDEYVGKILSDLLGQGVIHRLLGKGREDSLWTGVPTHRDDCCYVSLR